MQMDDVAKVQKSTMRQANRLMPRVLAQFDQLVADGVFTSMCQSVLHALLTNQSICLVPGGQFALFGVVLNWVSAKQPPATHGHPEHDLFNTIYFRGMSTKQLNQMSYMVFDKGYKKLGPQLNAHFSSAVGNSTPPVRPSDPLPMESVSEEYELSSSTSRTHYDTPEHGDEAEGVLTGDFIEG